MAGRAIGITRDTSLLDEVVKCLFSLALSDHSVGVKNTPESLASAYQAAFARVKQQCPSAFDSTDRILLDRDSIYFIHEALSDIDFMDPKTDPLSDLYQTFAGNEVKGNEGQFFTPPQAVNWIIEAIEPSEDEKIIDPACGAGSFLFGAARYLKSRGVSNSQIAQSIVGVEKDSYLARLANTHLALATMHEQTIICGDSIEQKGASGDPLPFPMEGEFDIVVANPPFGSKIKVGSEAARQKYDLAKKWTLDKVDRNFHKTDSFVLNPSPQILFLEICIRLLKPGGRLGVVVPESMISNTSSGHVVQYFLQHMDLNAVIGMPENLFKTSGKGGTHTKTCLLVAKKKKKHNQKAGPQFFMAEAKWCGNDSRGQKISRDDLPTILSNFNQWKAGDSIKDKGNLGYSVGPDEVRNFVLAPRYYDPIPKKELNNLSGTHDLILLGDLVDLGVIEIRTGDEVGKLAYGTGQIPFVRTSDISNWEVKIDPKHGVSEEIYASLAGKQDVRENDILMVKDGTYLIGTCALVTKFDVKILYQSHLYKIRVLDPTVISPYVLLAAFSSEIVTQQIQAKRFTQDIIDSLGKRILELTLPIPKSEDQVSYIEKIVKKSIDERVASRELARHAKQAIIDGSVL